MFFDFRDIIPPTYIYIIQHLVQSWPGPPGQLWTYSSELYIGRYIYLLKMYTYLSKTKGLNKTN